MVFIRPLRRSLGWFISNNVDKDRPRMAKRWVLSKDHTSASNVRFPTQDGSIPFLDRWIIVIECFIQLRTRNLDSMKPVTPTVKSLNIGTNDAGRNVPLVYVPQVGEGYYSLLDSISQIFDGSWRRSLSKWRTLGACHTGANGIRMQWLRIPFPRQGGSCRRSRGRSKRKSCRVHRRWRRQT